MGGGKSVVKSFSYTKEWHETTIDESHFSSWASAQQKRRAVCGNSPNPTWPQNVPKSTAVYVESIRLDNFGTSEARLIHSVNLNTTIMDFAAPSGWTKDASGHYASTSYAAPASAEGDKSQLGTVRVQIFSNDWDNPTVTVLGENHGGKISSWKTGSSWLCDGETVGELRNGMLDKEILFQLMRREEVSRKWIFRLIGFLILWFAISLLFGPLEVATDCIPCIGPCLEDKVEALTCCISCMPATACSSLVIGIVWVTMRPRVGVPLIAFFVLTSGSLAAYKVFGPKSKPRSDPFKALIQPQE